MPTTKLAIGALTALALVACEQTLTGAPFYDASSPPSSPRREPPPPAPPPASPPASTDDAGAPAQPACDPLPGDTSIRFDPYRPALGGGVDIVATSPFGFVDVAVRADGLPAPAWIGVTGDGPYQWRWHASGIAAGTYCVEMLHDRSVVAQRKLLTVGGEQAAVAPFKVVANHQWTCEEEYTWAINVDVRVEDEDGAPIPGALVALEHPPCDLRDQPEPPAFLQTGDDGTVRWENYYPKCHFHLRVADAPSDTAIEIYTGIWETQRDESGRDCNYCGEFAENVWGHWSYGVTFRRTPAASEICDVGTDHAGQARCSPLNHWEEPSGCTPVGG